MYHPLYPVAQRLVGRAVFVHHVNGTMYRGTLHSVVPHGIYVLSSGRQLMSGTQSDLESSIGLVENHDVTAQDVQHVYSPLAFFGFGALAGLSIGALAGRYYW